MTRKLIIDTDTAQDDCVALLVALLDPEAELEAITMVAGNVGFDRQVANAFMTLSVAGRLGDVPIYLGCTGPLVREWVSAEYVHGDGSGSLTMDLAGCVPEREHAVDALIRLVAENPGELDIVAIGPLTNIALAQTKDPSFAGNVRSLTIMGGSNNARGNITAAAEFNFYVDPEAAQKVFRSPFTITVLPWAPVTLRDAVFDQAKLSAIAALGTPLAEFFARVNGATIKFNERVGINGSTHPDSLSVSVLLHPELVTASAPYNVVIETGSELTRGYAAMSWGVHKLVPNATVVESVDADAFFERLLKILRTPTTVSRPFGD
jgi:purine nucleosidase